MYSERSRPDIFDYLNERNIKGLETEPTHESSLQDLQNNIHSYIISKGDDIEEYEYRYIAIVRIYSLIKDVGSTYQEQGESTLSRAIADEGMEEEEAYEISDRIGRYTVGNNVMVIYTMAYELINDLMGDILLNITDDEVATETGNSQLKNQIKSYQARADLLQHYNLVESQYHTNVLQIRDHRRELVHDIERRFDLKMLGSINDIWDIPHTINHLYEQLYDRPAYRFLNERPDN